MEPVNTDQPHDNPNDKLDEISCPEKSDIPEESTKIVLNDKHELFVHNLAVMKNATKAYLAVYPESSYNAARSSASELLTNPNIIARYKELTDPVRKILKELLSSHLLDLITFNVADIIDESGNVDMVKLKEVCIPGLVSGISIRDEETTSEKSNRNVKSTSIRLANQEKAVELLAKIEEIYKDKVEVSGDHVQIIVGKPRLKDGETLEEG